MELDNKKVFEILNTKKIWMPLLVGLGVVVYLFINDPDIKTSHLALISDANWIYMLQAMLLVACRDIGYMYRLRILTHDKLSWLACLYVIVLWEFSSAVTPSVVGGTVVAVFLLFKEGVELSKSLAYVMVTALFDNLFFILFSPFGFLKAYHYLNGVYEGVSGISFFFWIGYGITFVYTILSAFALFVKPVFFRWLLIKITSIKFLNRWQATAAKQGDDIIIASAALKGETSSYWFKTMLVTMIIWAARYAVMNVLMAAYVPIDMLQHTIIFGKQVIMWVVMLLSPTPGSSGTAEFFFKQLYGGLLGDYVLIVAVLWRLITYYFYLLIGVLILPRWLKRVFGTHLESASTTVRSTSHPSA